MSTHRECGEDITWTRREDGNGWAPPMEFVGYQYIITDHPLEQGEKVSLRVPVYKTHQCDPEKVLAWLEYKQRLADIEARAPKVALDQPDWIVARERAREERWELTLPLPCETCGVGTGQYCISLAKGPRHGEQLKNPHPHRLEAAENGNSSSST